ncbi:MAG: hypothetical protein U0174_22950 [Polyangiaceae bacterium]
MNIRRIISLCSASALLGFGLMACAVDSTGDEDASESSSAIQGVVPARPAPTNPCMYIKCAAGYTCDPKVGGCVANPKPLICPLSRCAPGYHCEEPTGCVPNFDCSTVRCASGTRNVPTLGCCLPTCGGIRGLACANGAKCVDDPTDSCDPQNGGADCGGVCVGGGASNTATK